MKRKKGDVQERQIAKKGILRKIWKATEVKCKKRFNPRKVACKKGVMQESDAQERWSAKEVNCEAGKVQDR